MNRSRIPWLVNADGSPGYTWSPTTGCGPGLPCYERCWARAYHVRYRGGDFSVKLHPSKLDEPLRLRKPSTIGVCLMGDLFHEDVPLDFLTKIAVTMERAVNARGHRFLVLTKRPDRMADWLQGVGERPPEGIWWGVSVEDQATADARIPILLDTPAAHRWVSLEPQVGAVDLTGWLRTFYSGDWGAPPGTIRSGAREKKLDLVIQGCESGPRRRPFSAQWARDVRDQCKEARVPFALKQMAIGGRIMERPGLDDDPAWNLPWAPLPAPMRLKSQAELVGEWYGSGLRKGEG